MLKKTRKPVKFGLPNKLLMPDIIKKGTFVNSAFNLDKEFAL